MKAEVGIKLEQVRELLKQQRVKGAMLGLQPNFSWLTAGGEGHVPISSVLANGRLIVTRSRFYLLANAIEMPRFLKEVVHGLEVVPLEYSWDKPEKAEALVKRIADPRHIVSDTGEWGTQSKPALFGPLRQSFQPAEVRRYRKLGRDAEEAVRHTAMGIEPGMSEFEIAGVLSGEALKRDLTPVVMLVAVDNRIGQFRHPIPSRKKLKKLAMVVLSARRAGQIVAMTRLVHFGSMSAPLRRKHEAVCFVDSVFHHFTRPGQAVRDIFGAGVSVYKAQGFADEWKRHHQGGASGYVGREFLGSSSSPEVVRDNQPFAWNPTITGTKSEDTILATAATTDVVTDSSGSDWPMIEIEVDGQLHRRPDILER